MKIFFINPRYSHKQWNGARIHVTQLVRNLVASGHDVFAYAHYAGDGMKPLAVTVGERFRQLGQMDAFYMRIDGIPPVVPRFLREPLRWFFRHVPLVWEINATPELQVSMHRPPDRERNRRFRRFRQLARHANLAICNTQGLANYAADLGIARRAVVPLGSDPELFHPDALGMCEVPANPDGLNVVWVGNPDITWHDFESIRAAARALLAEPRIRFFVVVPERSTGDLPPNVKLLAQRPYVEMPALLARMDVGLCLYRREDWTRYGTLTSPLKMFDYMACGLVVVGSPIDQVRECFERRDAGYIVPFENVEVIAATLLDILENKKHQSAKRAAGRALVTEHYNWARVADQTAGAITALGLRQAKDRD